MDKEKIRNDFNNNFRKIYIKNHPYCEYCGNDIEAKHVHHIIPIASGGDNRESNLISLCLECHGKIHNKKFNPNWKELQKIGIEKAKKEGKFRGGQIKAINKDKYFKLKNDYETQKITKTLFAKELGVSRPTLNKILQNETLYLKGGIGG